MNAHQKRGEDFHGKAYVLLKASMQHIATRKVIVTRANALHNELRETWHDIIYDQLSRSKPNQLAPNFANDIK